jgi:hypothetical protein
MPSSGDPAREARHKDAPEDPGTRPTEEGVNPPDGD